VPYEQAAEVFNRVGRRCQDAGLTFCYHNHDWEFRPTAEGAVPFERLAELTDPALVKFNMDVYWVTFAGQDVARFIATYGSRIPYVHLKDLKDGTFTELGNGTIDFPSVLEEFRLGAPVEWLVYEQDRTSLPTAEAVGISGRYLRQTLGL
jgi:sugar phosphate isomerase/epimerase